MIRHPVVAVVGTLLVLVLTAGYLVVGILHANPFADRTSFTVVAPQSNGLHTGSPVVMSGSPVGEVESVAYSTHRTVDITVAVDARYDVPVDSTLSIQAQSMLGEAAMFIQPPSSGSSKPIHNGQRLRAGTVAVPAAVPELLASTRTVVDQFDPELVNSLVNAVEEALTDVDDDMAKLTPAARAVAATMIETRPSLESLISSSMTILADGSWVAPSLDELRPELVPTAHEVTDLVVAVREFTAISDGGRRVVELWKPQFARVTKTLDKLAPRVGGVAQALLPAAQRSGTLLGQLNIASLVSAAMSAMPGDRLLLTLHAPRQTKGTR